jgi:hypothetical protein
MNIKKLKIISAFLMLNILVQSVSFGATATTTQAVSVTANEICVLGKTGNPSTLTVLAPSIAGTLPSNVTDSSTYLQYSANIPVTNQTFRRTITAQLTSAPTLGYGLKLHTPSVTAGCGTGIASGSAITLSSGTAQAIVTAIGNCATGTSATNGAQLYYATNITSMPYQGTDNLTVTFTLTAAV